MVMKSPHGRNSDLSAGEREKNKAKWKVKDEAVELHHYIMNTLSD